MKKLTLLTAVLLSIFTSISCDKKVPTPTPVVITPQGLPPISPHIRGVWLTNVGSQALYSKANIQAAVKNCRKNGINHIFVVMWNKGRTLYPSKVMKDTFGIEIEEGLSGRDPLRELLDAANADTIKVYAWMEYGFAAENNGAGAHILQQRPKWGAIGQDGNVVVKNGFKWMNPFNPSVQNFMMTMLKELATNYPDLAGIQGDDRLPALPSECGYNQEVIDEFKRENNGNEPSRITTDSTWVAWRVGKLNKFMQRIYTEIKAIRPNIKIAMAPSLMPFARDQYLQDWPTWVKNGWVDLISPQNYRYDIALYKKEIGLIINNQQVPPDKLNILIPGVLLNLSGYKPTETYLQQMIDENRAKGIKGEIFFYYEGLNEQGSFFQKYARN
jgi:uncharacterized lipoprotein YddW (UPF0748 family)